MKRLAVLIVTAVIFLSGCSGNNTASPQSKSESQLEQEAILQYRKESTSSETDEITEITEDYFAQKINSIYYNPELYVGKKITYEGIFELNYDENYKENLAYVFRHGPGCSEGEEDVGFEIIPAENIDLGSFTNNDWVKVTGSIVYTYHKGIQFLALEVTEMEVLETRGLETVS